LENAFTYTLNSLSVFDMDILVPDEEEVKAQYLQDQEKGIQQQFPYWSRIWPSAIAMARFLERHTVYIGREVLELGAGLAIPSFVASRYASHVTASDFMEESIRLTKQNISRLKLDNVSAEQLDWRNLPEKIQADTVLMSDINYSPRDFESLQKVIHRLLDAGSTIILSTPGRLAGKSFVEFLLPYIAYRETMNISGAEILIAVIIKKTEDNEH
jgi:predicted nicotinamide N-methyase